MKVCRLMCDKVSISRDEMRVKKKVMMVMTGFISLLFCMMPVKLETLKNYFWHLRCTCQKRILC